MGGFYFNKSAKRLPSSSSFKFLPMIIPFGFIKKLAGTACLPIKWTMQATFSHLAFRFYRRNNVYSLILSCFRQLIILGGNALPEHKN
jgi:hypothetical protein